MSQTRNTSEEIDFGMKEKMFVLFAAFVAIIIVFSAKVRQLYAKLWQRLEISAIKVLFFFHITIFFQMKFVFLGKKCNSLAFGWYSHEILLDVSILWNVIMFIHDDNQIIRNHCPFDYFLWFPKVKNVKSQSFSTHRESSSSLFYRLKCYCLNPNELQKQSIFVNN